MRRPVRKRPIDPGVWVPCCPECGVPHTTRDGVRCSDREACETRLALWALAGEDPLFSFTFWEEGGVAGARVRK